MPKEPPVPPRASDVEERFRAFKHCKLVETVIQEAQPILSLASVVEDARSRWNEGKARFLTHGLLLPFQPMLHRVSGLHVSSIGRIRSEEDIDYLEQYNAQLEALRQEFGLPSWAPGSRLPKRSHLVELMSGAHPLTSVEELEALGLGDLGYRVRFADLVPVVVYRRLEDMGLLLLGSDISRKKACIDVLDLREKVWMVSEEFDRKEVGPMPWDSLPRDVKDAVPALHEAAEAARAAAAAARDDAEEALLRVEFEARERRAEANRQRGAELLEEMKDRELACPHCQVRSRDFRFLPSCARFVCPSCARSSAALDFARGD